MFPQKSTRPSRTYRGQVIAVGVVQLDVHPGSGHHRAVADNTLARSLASGSILQRRHAPDLGTDHEPGLFGWFISGPWYIDLTGNRLADGTKFQVWEQTGNPPYPENAEQECGPENASGQPVESGLCVP
jgi:hypothetical protein